MIHSAHLCIAELLEVTSGCPLLISPLAIVLDVSNMQGTLTTTTLTAFCASEHCRSCAGEALGQVLVKCAARPSLTLTLCNPTDENGIYQAISLSTSTLLPFVATLTLPSSMALAEQLGIPAADMQRQSRALRRAICKQIARMREALNEKALADMVATTPSSRQAPAWPVRVVEVADESLRVVADAGMDEASIRLREESVEVIRKKIERQIAPVFGGDIYVRVFGSTLTGLTHPRSDIDMTVISDNTGDHRKEIRNSIISELKSVELILIALSELERTASMANSCIERFRNIIQEGSQQVSDVDDLAADVEAIQIEDIEYTEPPVQQNQPASMQYFRSIILKKAGAAFKVLHDLYSALEASAAPALEERRQLRISLSSVDQEMLEDKKRLIFRLTRVLRQGGCYEVVPVTEARIGVIHFVDTTPWDKSVPWQCDLVVNQKLGIHNSRLIRAYLEFDSSGKIKQFLRLVKLFAKSHKLNLAPNGLLSSYAWIVLGLIFLLRCEYVPNFQQDLRDVVLCDGINVNFLVPSKIGVALDKLHATLLPDLCLQFFTYLTEQVNICTDVLTMRGKGEVMSTIMYFNLNNFVFRMAGYF